MQDGIPATLAPYPNATLNISGLSTENVGQVELIAQNMQLTGQWNTQMRGTVTANGAVFSPNGPQIIGTGGINIFYGFNVDYPTLKINKHLSPNNTEFTLPASLNITSAAVQITSDAPRTIVNATINTQSDANSAFINKGQIATIKESIRIEAFNTNDASTALTVNGKLTSDIFINLVTTGQLNVNGQVQAAEIEYEAGNTSTLMHRGHTKATGRPAGMQALRLKGKNVENNGTLLGPSVLISGTNSVQNRFGGFIQSDLVQIESTEGFIRNGSQYPFKQDGVNLLVNPTNTQIKGNFATLDLQFNGLPFENATRVNSVSAFVFGKTIILKAKGRIENINPYFEYTLDASAWLNGIPFSPAKTAQVQVVAENQLKMSTDDFLLNSSAVLGVNNNGAGSIFLVNAPNIRNERYTNQTVITNDGNNTDLHVFSPAGSIYSFAPIVFGITAKGGMFFNNTSYFEALSNATITSKRSAEEAETAQVTNIGMLLTRQETTSITTSKTRAECEKEMGSGYTSEAYDRRCGSGTSTTQYYTSTETKPKGTLFYVAGTTEMPKVNLLNHDMKAELIADQTWKYVGPTGSVANKTDSFGGGCYGCSDWYIKYSVAYSWNTLMSYDATNKTYLFNQQVTSYKILSATQTVGGTTTDISATFNPTNVAKEFKYDVGDTVGQISISVTQYFKDALTSLKNLLTAFTNWLNRCCRFRL